MCQNQFSVEKQAANKKRKNMNANENWQQMTQRNRGKGSSFFIHNVRRDGKNGVFLNARKITNQIQKNICH